MALQLGGRRSVHDEHAAPRPDLPRGERHTLRRVAGADGPDPAFESLGLQLAHGVVGAANLEGADRLQRFQLEEDLGWPGAVGAATSGVRRATS